MKRLLVALLMLFAVSLYAQQTATTTANVTANVSALLTITKTADLTFGTIVQGATATVLSTGAGVATFTIQGTASASTTVTVTFPATVVNGANSMTFTGQQPRYNTVNVQGSSLTTGWGLTGGNTNSSSTGQLFLWMGGSVTASPTQQVGSYTGTITVQVTQP